MSASRVAWVVMLTLLALAVAPLYGALPSSTLVKEINLTTVARPQISNFGGFITALGGQALFLSQDAEHGTELWRTDGTTGGTRLLADLSPGPEGVTAPFPEQTVIAGSRSFFVVLDSSGPGLWVSDGTTAGTRLLHTTRLLNIAGLTAVGDRVFFTTVDSSLTAQLWVSDGTGVTSVRTWSTTAAPVALTALGDTLLFVLSDSANGAEVWRSDGTEAGTLRVTDLNPGAGSAFSSLIDTATTRLVTLGGQAYFFASDGAQTGLWRTDGTSAGTALVRSVSGRQLARAGGQLFFESPVTGPQTSQWLWRSDGTSAGTTQLYDFGTSASSLSDPTEIGGRLYFIFGGTPWVSDGATTIELTAMPMGDYPGPTQRRFVGSGDLVFFKGGGVSDAELWVTDGTAAATREVLDINVGAGSGPSSLQMLGAVVLFYANSGSTTEIWKSDGSEAGTAMLRTASAPDGVDGAFQFYERGQGFQLQDVGGRLFFAANSGGSNVELWVSDGTDAATALVKEINPGGTALPRQLVSLGGRAYFIATQGVTPGLWVSDGTDTGTTLLADSTASLALHDGAIWYLRASGGSYQLWRSDGTDAGVSVATLPSQAVASGLVSVGGRLFFTIQLVTGELDLWVSDGTGGGTTKAKTLASPGTGVTLLNFVPLAGRAIFVRASFNSFANFTAYDLWVSDGTDAGTIRLAEFGRMARAPQPVVVGDRAFLAGADLTNGTELWVSDGTITGTTILKDINTSPGMGSQPRSLVNLGGTLLFAADDGEHGYELWASDGSATGTRLLKDIHPGLFGSGADNLRVIGETLFFSAGDGPSGTALWKSDGSASGTIHVREVAAGPTSASPRAMTQVGPLLFFLAHDEATGLELHALPLAAQYGASLPLVVR